MYFINPPLLCYPTLVAFAYLFFEMVYLLETFAMVLRPLGKMMFGPTGWSHLTSDYVKSPTLSRGGEGKVGGFNWLVSYDHGFSSELQT